MVNKKFVPPGAKGEYVDICAARGLMGYRGNLCRQGPNGNMRIFVPPGAEWDIGEICAARGLII